MQSSIPRLRTFGYIRYVDWAAPRAVSRGRRRIRRESIRRNFGRTPPRCPGPVVGACVSAAWICIRDEVLGGICGRWGRRGRKRAVAAVHGGLLSKGASMGRGGVVAVGSFDASRRVSPRLAASRHVSPRLATSRRVSCPHLATSRCVSLRLAASRARIDIPAHPCVCQPALLLVHSLAARFLVRR